MTGPLDAALDYLSRGWWVFPTMPRGKEPATNKGVHAATNDPDVARHWWAANPELNVAIATGPSGLVVVDCDYNESSGVNGVAGFITLAHELGHNYPDTLEVDTPNGGHLYFAAPPGLSIGSTVGRLGPGIDTRGDGGYVVAPGSVAPMKNRPHRLESYDWVNDRPVAELPGWIADRVSSRFARGAPSSSGSGSGSGSRFRVARREGVANPRAHAETALRAEVNRVRNAVEGTRNDTLNRAAFSLGQLVAGGVLGEVVVVDELTRVARAVGLEDRETRLTIRSGITKGQQNPRTGAA